jgi:hypothetical protein
MKLNNEFLFLTPIMMFELLFPSFFLPDVGLCPSGLFASLAVLIPKTEWLLAADDPEAETEETVRFSGAAAGELVSLLLP